MMTAPDDLEVVRRFVNTYDVENCEERLGTPEQARAWLTDADLPGAGDRIDDDDLRRALDVREALRALMLANHDDREPPPHALAVLDVATERATLRVRFAPDGATDLVPAAGGMDGALAEILARVRTAMVDGRWRRLKVCPAEDCRWAYYDHSRNRSRRWCKMEVCGNRAKVRHFRERQDA